MRNRYVFPIMFIVLLALIHYYPNVLGAVTYTNVIEINHAQDVNAKDLPGTAGQVKFINLDNGTVHGPYALNSTGGYKLTGAGNATNYRIEIYWEGTKVNETTITTSATAGATDTVTPVKCHVWDIAFTFKDANNNNLLSSAVSVKMTLPNGTHVSFSSPTPSITQASNGTYYIAVQFEGSYVYGNTSFSLDTANTSLTISTKVYQFSISVLDFLGRELRLQYLKIVPPNSSLITFNDITRLYMPQVQNGTWILEAYYRDDLVNRTNIALSANTALKYRMTNLYPNITGIDVFVRTGTLDSASYTVGKEIDIEVNASAGTLTETIIYLGKLNSPYKIYAYNNPIPQLLSWSKYDSSTTDGWYYNRTNTKLYVKATAHSPIPIVVKWYTATSKASAPSTTTTTQQQPPPSQPLSILDTLRQGTSNLLSYIMLVAETYSTWLLIALILLMVYLIYRERRKI